MHVPHLRIFCYKSSRSHSRLAGEDLPTRFMVRRSHQEQNTVLRTRRHFLSVFIATTSSFMNAFLAFSLHMSKSSAVLLGGLREAGTAVSSFLAAGVGWGAAWL